MANVNFATLKNAFRSVAVLCFPSSSYYSSPFPTLFTDFRKSLLPLIFLMSCSAFGQAPTIASFAPLKAAVGAQITITGANFNPTPTNNSVYFGATKAAVVAASTTQLLVTVPVGATFQSISVSVGGFTGHSSAFFTPLFTPLTNLSASSFSPVLDFAVGTPEGIAIGDIDGDGKADLVIANANNNAVSIVANKSVSGTLSPTSLAAAVNFSTGLGSAPKNVALGDLDRDGKMDVVVSNINNGTLSIFKNTSTPGSITTTSLASRVNISVGGVPTDVKVADIDGDGRLDIVVLNTATAAISVLRNTITNIGTLTTGSFFTKVDFAVGSGPELLAVTDLDGDGKPELVATNSLDDTFSVLQNISLEGNITINSFLPKLDFSTGNSPLGLSVADLDGDGKKDIVVSNNVNDNTVSVFRNTISNGVITGASFSTRVNFATGSAPYGVAVADVDGDGKPEICAANNSGSTISIFKNTSTAGTITTGSFATALDFAVGSTPGSIAIGDLDGDGKADLSITGTGSKTTLSVLRNTLGEGIAIAPTVAATPSSQIICSGSPTNIVLSNPNNIAGTTYSWTVATSSGLSGASAGSGSTITQTLMASTTSETATYTITPMANSLEGTPITVSITVINTIPPAPVVGSQVTYCQGAATVALQAVGSNLLWYAAAVGGIGSSTTPVPSSLSVGTKSYFVSQSLASCGESPRAQLDVVVNPIPTLSSSLAPINACTGVAFAYSPTSSVAGTTFSWTRANVAGVTPAISGGTGAINEALTNATASTLPVSYSIIPTANGCVGTTQVLSVNVNPAPVGIAITGAVLADQPLGAAFSLATPTTSVAAASYTITIAAGGLVSSAGLPVDGAGKTATELVDDAWSNSSTSATNVVYSVTPVSSNGCSGGVFTVTASVQPPVIFNVAVSTADLNVPANTPSTANNGIITGPVVNSGSKDRALLGVTFDLLNKITGIKEPLLNEFVISFNNPINNIIRLPKIYQSANSAFDSKDKLDVLVSTTLTVSANSIRVQFTSPRDLSLGKVTYFLVADIDPFVNTNTLPIVPSLAMANIIVSRGIISGTNIVGRSYSFNDVTPPQPISLIPANGSENFSAQNIMLEFDETVTSLDRKISVYTLDRVKVADLVLPATTPSTGKVFSFPVTGLKSITNYYISIAAGDVAKNTGFFDQWGNGFDGFNKISDWAFRTPDPLAPVFVTTSSTAKNPNLKNDFIDINLLGGNLQVALNKAGKVYYLVTPSPSTRPTAAQVFSATTYTATVLTAGTVLVAQDSTLQYGPVVANFVNGNNYDVWLAAENTVGVRMDDTGVQKLTFTASVPPPSSFDPLIVSAPKMYTVCIGNHQTLSYPITISERQVSDFVVDPIVNGVTTDQSVSFLLPQGFEYNITAKTDTVMGKGSDLIIKSFSYNGTSVFTIVYSVVGVASLDLILIKGLQIKATGVANATGDIYRLGGNGLATIADFASLGKLKAVQIPSVGIDLHDAATNQLLTGSVPNSIPLLSLRPHVSMNRYGVNSFTGNGVTDDLLVPTAAGLGVHTLTIAHTDENGCRATASRTISIYDFTKAVNGMDTIYNVNDPVRVTILRNGKGNNYTLKSLRVTSPTPTNFDIDITKSLIASTNGSYVFIPKLFNTPQNRINQSGARLGTLSFEGIYQNLTTGQDEVFMQHVGIYAPPRPSVSIRDNAGNHSSEIFCEDLGTVLLSGLPKPAGNIIGFYTFEANKPAPNSGLIDPLDGNGTLDTKVIKAKNGYGVFKLRYIAQNTLTKGSDTTVQLIRISPQPTAKFTTSIPCVFPERVLFTDASTVAFGSIKKYRWNFGDDKPTSIDSLKSPSYSYTDPRPYSVSLVVVSDLGCSSDRLYSQTVTVGGIPATNFTFKGISTNDNITFKDSTKLKSVVGDNIKLLEWNFGDNSSGVGSTTSRKYAAPGVYSVKLTATSQIGCVKTKTLKVGVVPQKIFAAETDVYAESFDIDGGGWQTLRDSANSVRLSSWKRLPASAPINAATGIWKTENLKGSYDAFEHSFLYSPVFNFTALKRPVISFEAYHKMELNDGVVLEYSTDEKNIADSTKEWKNSPSGTLGVASEAVPSGLNWYNGIGLLSKPGNQAKGDYGWTKIDTSKWREARHSLDAVPPANRGRVVFRFALGSTSSPKIGGGFALDKVRIGSRTRTVLLESFNNLTNTSTDANNGNRNVEKYENSILMDDSKFGENIVTGTDVVKLSYHVGFPKEDVFNLDNPNDPGARALYYNISNTPRVQMDGTLNGNGRLFSSWINDFRLQTLKLAGADIKVSGQTITSGPSQGAIKGTVTITARGNKGDKLPKETTVLQLALVEQKINLTKLTSASVLTGEATAEYVVKKLYPSAAGTKFANDLLVDTPQTIDFEWTPDLKKFYPFASDLTKPNLAVVAILQNTATKEVYQTAIAMNLDYPPVITGLENVASDAIYLYPTPADKQFMVELPAVTTEPVVIHMIDQLGKIVATDVIAEGQQRTLVPTETMTPGVYIIQLSTEAGKMIRKKILVWHE